MNNSWPLREASDFRYADYRKRILSVEQRIEFDPSNRKHLLDFARFVKYNKWVGGCAYFLEDPYSDIPTMIQNKIARHAVRKLIEKV
jgi:hypothetical protein